MMIDLSFKSYFSCHCSFFSLSICLSICCFPFYSSTFYDAEKKNFHQLLQILCSKDVGSTVTFSLDFTRKQWETRFAFPTSINNLSGSHISCLCLLMIAFIVFFFSFVIHNNRLGLIILVWNWHEKKEKETYILYFRWQSCFYPNICQESRPTLNQ